MEQHIRDNVLKVAKEQEVALREQIGIEPSLTEEDMKKYLEQVIEEVKKSRRSTILMFSFGILTISGKSQLSVDCTERQLKFILASYIGETG